MNTRPTSIELLTGEGPAMRECPECAGTGVLVSDNGPDPLERGCERCGGSGERGCRGAPGPLHYGRGEIAALCDDCGDACQLGRALLLKYPATRDEYCCGGRCALWRIYGNVADELLELPRLPLELIATPQRLISPPGATFTMTQSTRQLRAAG